MTKHLRALLKVEWLNAWRGMFGGKRSKLKLLLLPLLGIGVVPILFVSTMLYLGIFVAGKMMGQDHLVLTIALTAGQLTILIFGIMYIISAFFFSTDLRILVPLPLRPSEILLAKFVRILVNEYLTMTPIVLPGLVVYGIMADVSWTFVPFAIVIFLLLPTFPLVLASLVSLVIMRLTNLKGSKELWRALGILLGVLVGVSFQFISRLGANRGFSAQNIEQVIQSQGSMITTVGRFLPTSGLATNSLRAGAAGFGLGSFLLFVGVSIGALALLLWVAEKIFMGGLIGSDERRSSAKAMNHSELAKATGQVRSQLMALFQREIRLFVRTPAFLLSATLPVLILPIMTLLPLLQEKKSAAFFTTLQRYTGSPLVIAIVVPLFLFISSTSAIAASGISREGRYFWISRILPVPPRLQIQAKVMHSVLFALLPLVTVVGIGVYLRLFSPLTLTYTLIGCMVASCAASFGSITMDLISPHLTWTDPQKAMKGTKNSLLSLLFTLIMMAINFGLGLALALLAGPWTGPILIVALGIEALLLSKLAGFMADKRYAEMEG